MRIRVLGCYGGESPECRLTCLLLNDTLALDAGCLAQALPIEAQARVRSIILSHSHIDHTSSLPFFIDNVYGSLEGPIDIYASAPTIEAVRQHLFNNATWPDFTRLPNAMLPSMRFIELEAESPVEIDGLSLTPIPVAHPVPTFGFLIEDATSSVLWSSDTGPTDRLWDYANRVETLKAICLDTSFDSSLQKIADLSLHLTPRTLAVELKKLHRRIPVLLHHLKPHYIEAIRGEVARMANPDISYLEQGRVYDFS